MSRHNRFGPALSLVAFASIMSGCAAPQSHVASFGGKTNGEIGLATRAMAALNSNDVPTAIDLAERAVQKTPDDAGFRALLGNAYFAGGRFQSAEQAYKDSLSIYSNQPQVVLKLALVEIGLGKNAEALGFLEAGREVIDPADYGLAVALAGRPDAAIQVLQDIARRPDADARVRQNLALAYALSGDWTNARTVASQDVPADQLDARIHQWMQLASPGKGSTAVAALVGVTPAPVDPGQPTRLALNKTNSQVQQAQAAPVQAPVVAEQQVAQSVPAPVPASVDTVAPPPPVAVAEVAPQPVPFLEPTARPKAARKPQQVAHVAPTVKPAKLYAASGHGGSRAVVQLGAYSNSGSVLLAWNSKARKFRSLSAYTPMSARFASPKGTFYRLSVKGFGSVNEAMALCSSLRRAGGTCFVRNLAGDAPVNIASAS
jgi:D-alanyl-D-alanine carboxypeptidase